MRTVIILSIPLFISLLTHAQKSHYDSIREMLRKDSIEYQEQLRDADRIKAQTDSVLKNELGYINPITSRPDSTTVLKNLRALAVQELKKKEEEENKKYYLFIASVMLLLIIVIVAVKRKQFVKQEDEDKNEKAK